MYSQSLQALQSVKFIVEKGHCVYFDDIIDTVFYVYKIVDCCFQLVFGEDDESEPGIYFNQNSLFRPDSKEVSIIY